LKNIAIKLSLLLVSTTILVLIILGIFGYYFGQRSINTELGFKFETTLNRLKSNLKQSIWEYNIDAIRDVVSSEFPDPTLGAILIWKENKTSLLFGLGRIDGKLTELDTVPDNINFIVRSTPIHYLSETNDYAAQIASLSIYLDRSIPEKELLKNLTEELLKFTLVIVFLLFLLFIIVYRLIVVPLELIRKDMFYIEKRALDINQENFESTSAIPIQDQLKTTFSEIKQIAAIYQKMLNSISQRQNALMESENRYRSLFESASTAIFLMDNDQFIDCNPRTLELFGCTREQIINETPNTFSPELQTDGSVSDHETQNYIKQALNGTPQMFEWEYQRLDQSRFDAEVSLNRTYLQNKYYIFSFVKDITHRKKAEAELGLTYKKLEKSYAELREKQEQLVQSEKMAALGILSSGIAHEITQPLMGISMSVEQILFKVIEKRLSPDVVKKKCNEMLDYIARIKSTIEHVRVFSREQKIEQFNIFNINECVEDSLLLVQTQYKNHGIELFLDLDRNTPSILGNSYKVEQIILNLLSNSRDAIEEKERTQKINFQKQITISTGVANNKVYVAVRDNGIGVDPNIKKHIFEPFFTTKEANQGTGLGLSVAFGIVEEMKGEIEVENQEDANTVFRLLFPIA
jgi:PAS domain S-box-containing protein